MKSKILSYIFFLVLGITLILLYNCNMSRLEAEKRIGCEIKLNHEKVMMLLYGEYVIPAFASNKDTNNLHRAMGYMNGITFTDRYIKSESIITDFDRTRKIIRQNINSSAAYLENKEELSDIAHRNVNLYKLLVEKLGEKYHDDLLWYKYYKGEKNIIYNILK